MSKTSTSQKKEVLMTFGSKINAVSMDDRFLIVGMEDGSVECVYTHGGGKAPTRNWVTKISEIPITAVLADTFDADNDPLFYAGDAEGVLYLINAKGKVVSDLKAREDAIYAILDKNIKEVVAYSEGGESLCKLENNKLVKKRSKASKFSMDNDAAFYTKREKGDMAVECYKCPVPAGILGTTRIQVEWDDEKSYLFVNAYSTLSKRFKDLVDKDEAPTTLDIVDKNQRKIRQLEFASPVKQVVNHYVEKPSMRKDAIYVLLWNDQIVKFKASELALDETEKNEKDLTQVLIYDDEAENKTTNNDGDIRLFYARMGKVAFVTETDEDVVFYVNDEE